MVLSRLNGGSLGELFVSIGTDMRELDKGLNSASARIKRFSAQTSAATDAIGRGLTRSGLAISAFLGATATASIRFESAFAGVRKTVDASEAEFQRLELNLRSLSKEIPSSSAKLAEIAEIAGQLGITGVENITNFTKTIALLGDTTDIQGEVAALQLSRFINIMQTSQDDVDRLGATIVELGNNFAARESEIVDLSLSLASFGSQINLTESQVLAYATVIKAAGGEAQAAGTAFQKVALDMKNAVITGNRDLTEFARVAGLSAEEFRQAFQEDAGAAFALFLKGLRDIDEAGGSVQATLEDLGLADQRLVREFGKVIRVTDQLDRAMSLANEAWQENTALTEEAEKRYKTTAAQGKILFNNLTDIAIKLGNAILPVINDIISDLRPMLDRFAAWIDNNQELTKEIVILTAKVGAFLLVLGPIVSIFGRIISSVSILVATNSLPALGALITGIASALGSLALVGAAAFVGWRVGEALRDLTGLDKIIFDISEALIKASRNFSESTVNILAGYETQKFVFEDLKRNIDEVNQKILETQSAGQNSAALTGLGAGLTGLLGTNNGFGAPQEDQNLGDEGLTEEQKDAEKTAKIQEQRRQHYSFLETLDRAFTKSSIKRNETRAEVEQRLAQDSFNTLSSLLRQQGSENKTAAKLFKGVQIGRAIIGTSRAVTEALPNLALAGLVAAIGAAEIATIASTKFAKGSVDVPGGGGITDPGEIVVPKTFAQGIREGRLTLAGPEEKQGSGRGAGGNVTFENIEINVGGDFDEFAVPQVVEKIGIETESQLRGA